MTQTVAISSVRPVARRRSPLAKAARRVPTILVIIALVLVMGYPLVWMFLNSLKTNSDFLNNPSYSLPEVWAWENYADAWETGNLAVTISNSLLAVVPSVLIIALLGTAAGFALEVMIWKGRNTVLLVFLAGIMIPGQMILLPLFTAFFNLRITGSLLPLILIYVGLGLPLTVFMMATYFRAIPREVFEASTLDGASMLRSFFSIGLPMVRNAIFTVAIVQFFLLWNDLLFALVFAGQRRLNTIQIGLLNFSGEFGAINYGPLFAAICITTAGILVLYLFLNQRIMNGLAAGAVKG
ncbi:carbohydrate ABC transporter permease [Pseudolysinimonas sp.]|jgi:raffinose/stachyose/melibiose transport system permease protein|uniref:carbohydrate ABC transporter permease n=1 Tax=Pseudolysinimonas sp. TaxID=2680009 RepID=UPI003784C0A1